MRIGLAALFVLTSCSSAPAPLRIEGASVADRRGALQAGIGIAVGSKLVHILEPGCELPCTASQAIRTASRDQRSIRFYLHQGRGDSIADAKPLGVYEVSWDEGSPAPVREIAVIFKADTTGAYIAAEDSAKGEPLQVSRVAR